MDFKIFWKCQKVSEIDWETSEKKFKDVKVKDFEISSWLKLRSQKTRIKNKKHQISAKHPMKTQLPQKRQVRHKPIDTPAKCPTIFFLGKVRKFGSYYLNVFQVTQVLNQRKHFVLRSD